MLCSATRQHECAHWELVFNVFRLVHSLNNVVLPPSVLFLLVNITDNAYAVSVVVCKTTAFAEAPNPFPNISSQTEGDSERK